VLVKREQGLIVAIYIGTLKVAVASGALLITMGAALQADRAHDQLVRCNTLVDKVDPRAAQSPSLPAVVAGARIDALGPLDVAARPDMPVRNADNTRFLPTERRLSLKIPECGGDATVTTNLRTTLSTVLRTCSFLAGRKPCPKHSPHSGCLILWMSL
jgi:hypothetical protein